MKQELVRLNKAGGRANWGVALVGLSEPNGVASRLLLEHGLGSDVDLAEE